MPSPAPRPPIQLVTLLYRKVGINELSQVHTRKKCVDCDQHPGLTVPPSFFAVCVVPRVEEKDGVGSLHSSIGLSYTMWWVDLKKNFKSR